MSIKLKKVEIILPEEMIIAIEECKECDLELVEDLEYGNRWIEKYIKEIVEGGGPFKYYNGKRKNISNFQKFFAALIDSGMYRNSGKMSFEIDANILESEKSKTGMFYSRLIFISLINYFFSNGWSVDFIYKIFGNYIEYEDFKSVFKEECFNLEKEDDEIDFEKLLEDDDLDLESIEDEETIDEEIKKEEVKSMIERYNNCKCAINKYKEHIEYYETQIKKLSLAMEGFEKEMEDIISDLSS